MTVIKNDFLKNIGRKKFFRRLLRQSLSIVGVDIGAGFIKAAEISFAGKKPVLKAAGIIAVPGGINKEGRIANIQALPTLLKKLWVDSALTCRDVITAIDARSVFAREFVFPAMSLDELKVAVKWDIEEYVPYKESYYYDFAEIKPDSASDGESAGECRVFLAAAPVKIVDDVTQALNAAHCKVWAVDVEALAMAAAIGGAWDGVNVIVDIGCFHSQIIVFSGQVPVLTRIIPWGGQKFTELIVEKFGLEFGEAEKFKLCRDEPKLNFDAAEFRQKEARLAQEFERLNTELGGEIRHTFSYLPPNRQGKVKNIYLTGGGASFKNLAGGIAAGLGEIAVSVPNPLEWLDISPEIDKNYLNRLAPQLTIAVGLALRGGIYDSD